ncbi:MAG: ATP-dependent helicase HrpB [Gammaproteobacteria bacterium]|nr:MAG: ATP-dependent helicase HrpB [Gammaproteobacteria bacterium]
MDLPALPIASALPEIDRRLREGHLVLGAPPGSGKTTLVPLALLGSDWLAGRKILMLEPRRPAARMAAHRMAQLLAEPVGRTVGYQVRFDRRIGPQTRIEVLTEGLLLRRLQDDPELSGVGLVIFDEFHERSLDADLALALCLEVANGLRDDLRLMPMSASLDGESLVGLMGAQSLQAEGRAHPVEIHHLDSDPSREELPGVLQRLVRRALAEAAGDLLVFLPGKGEIRRLAESLGDLADRGVEVQPLHGEIPAERQDAIIRGTSGARRVVLATDIAETSLTIEGIGVVIDSGLSRKPRFDPNSGLIRLHTDFISQASALQRAGRAGRQGPGVCYRAWSAARQRRLDPEIRPEILEADLAPLVLALADWGVTEPDDLAWVTPPPRAHWAQARELLVQLEALDSQGRITPAGRAMSRLPLHPRLAHMLLAAPDAKARRLAADIAALLGERDPMQRRGDEPLPCDVEPRLEALTRWRRDRHAPPGFDRQGLQRMDQVARQLRGLATETAPIKCKMQRASPGTLLALAYPDRVALARRPGAHCYRLRNGRAACLPARDALRGQELLVAASLDAGRREGRIWLAAPLARSDLDPLFGEQIQQARELGWDPERQAVGVRRTRRLGALVLEAQPETLTPQDDPLPLLLEQVREQGLDLFDQSKSLRQLQGRIALLRHHLPEQGWPDLSDAALLERLEEWLSPWLNDCTSLRELRQVPVVDALQGWVGREKIRKIEQLLPSHYETPAGTRRPIEYPAEGEPILRVPLQEMLGQTETPRIAEGRIPLLLHLLSPAMRPLQITGDLANFWREAYPEVRKEMRGRYPKHAWPEDPANAAATRLGRTRRSR